MSTPSFPTSVPTIAAMRGTMSNNLAGVLANDIDNLAVSVALVDASSFPTTGEITIGTEIIQYTGKSTNTLTGCTRGYDGTTAASHTAGDVVNQYYIADDHNRVVAEVNAIAQNISDRLGLGQSTYIVLPAGVGIIFQPTSGQYYRVTADEAGIHTEKVVLS